MKTDLRTILIDGIFFSITVTVVLFIILLILFYVLKYNKKSYRNEEDVYRLFMMFCDGFYEHESQSTSNTFQMGITKLEYDKHKNVLHVYVRKPGLLIGKGGSNINSLKEYVECEINIHEVRQLWK